MRIHVSAVAILALILCSCATTKVEKLALELRHPSEQLPSTCSEKRLLAEKAFREKWVTHLLIPVQTTGAKSNAETGKNGQAYVAPVQSYRIALNERTLTNQMVSAFINCEKDEGYVQARGGFADQESWYGPFKF